jgi:Domain of unknown function (DUF929)
MNMKKEYVIYIVAAAVIIIGIVAYLLLNTSSGCSSCGKQVSSTYIRKLSAAANNYDLANQVGAGVVLVSGPYANLPKIINATPLKVDGKPEIFYVGGDFCPFCAVSRWGLIIALMRFGNFTNLTYMESGPSPEPYPNTATFSFTNSSYSSSLIHFDGIEVLDREEKNITNINFTPTEQFIYGRYANGIPFVDFANYSISNGASITPQVLSGQNWNQILENLTNSHSAVSQAIIGDANVYTAYICKSDPVLNATATACKQSYIKAVLG